MIPIWIKPKNENPNPALWITFREIRECGYSWTLAIAAPGYSGPTPGAQCATIGRENQRTVCEFSI